MSFSAASTKSTGEWFIDSGGSKHMTHEVQRLTNLRPSEVNKITIANNDVMKVKNVGDTILQLADSEIKMHDVLHVPDLGVNLLSVSQIVNKWIQ